MPATISRNAPCPCGSGKKFKQCCLAIGRPLPAGETAERFRASAPTNLFHLGLPQPVSPTPRLSAAAPAARSEWKELHLDVPLHDGTALHIVLLHSEHWLRTKGYSVGYGMTVNLPQISYKGMALLTAVRPAEWAAAAEGELKAVFHRGNDGDGGILVLGARRTRSTDSFRERCAGLRLVSLELIERRGHLARRVNIELLRSVEWIRERKLGVGASVLLNEPSEGLHGRATVRGIQPCPPRERWLEKMRVGEFEPWPLRVGDLKIASESKPIGVTPGHPIWSADRNDFVSAGRLEPGERVLTMSGPSAVEWYVMREKPEDAVYNLEVDTDHVFRVGEQGVLVHNNSVPGTPTTTTSQEDCNPCDELKIGIDATGKIFDDRRWERMTITARDERGPKFTSTRGQNIAVEVVDYAIARLTSTTGGTDPDPAALAWVQCLVGVKKDDAGHVIGDSLGGKGELKHMNIFPQNYSRNRGIQSTFEKNVVKPAVTSNKNVCVLIKLSYVNTDPDYPGRPTKVLYYAWIDGVKHTRVFDNDFPQDAFTPVPGKPNYCSEQSR